MIKYNLKLTHIESRPEIISYLEGKIDQISKFVQGDLENTFSEIELAKITEHHKQGEIFKAEINLRTSDGSFFRADATSSDLFSAMDEVRAKISKEIRRSNNKGNTLLKRGGRAIKNMLKGFRE